MGLQRDGPLQGSVAWLSQGASIQAAADHAARGGAAGRHRVGEWQWLFLFGASALSARRRSRRCGCALGADTSGERGGASKEYPLRSHPSPLTVPACVTRREV